MRAKMTPYLMALGIQVIYTGMFLLSKVAFDVGMNTFVFVFYRQIFGTVVVAPIAFFLERKTVPRFTFKVFLLLFALSLCGMTLGLNLNGVGVKYTSATLASAAANSVPVITFILALLTRIEKVNPKKITGIAKIIGICLCTGGAATIAVYTGPTFKLLLHHHLFNIHGSHENSSEASSSSSGKKWIIGVVLTFLSNILWSTWIVLQERVLREYPSKLMSTALQAIMSSVQSFIVAIAFERDFDKWKLGWNVQLFSVAYSGITVTGIGFYLQSWVVQKRGPVFLSMTTPLSLILTMAASAFFFGSILSLGSILGAVFLVGGLYCVMWGKGKELKMAANNTGNSIAESEKGSLVGSVNESTVENNAPAPRYFRNFSSPV